MTGHIILFRSPLAAGDAAPSSRSNKPRRRADKRTMRLQLARIARLLEELEEIGGPNRDDPGSRHQFGIDRAHRMVRQLAERCDAGESDGQDDPQPHVVHQILERMYRELNPET